jgi:hypothetical protein
MPEPEVKEEEQQPRRHEMQGVGGGDGMVVSFAIMTGDYQAPHPVFIDIIDDDDRFAEVPLQIRSIVSSIRDLEHSLTLASHPRAIGNIQDDLKLLMAEASFVANELPQLRQTLMSRILLAVDNAQQKQLHVGHAMVRRAAILADTIRAVLDNVLPIQSMPDTEAIEAELRAVDDITSFLSDESADFYWTNIRRALVAAWEDSESDSSFDDTAQSGVFRISRQALSPGFPQG